jgi:hypothetical protein
MCIFGIAKDFERREGDVVDGGEDGSVVLLDVSQVKLV